MSVPLGGAGLWGAGLELATPSGLGWRRGLELRILLVRTTTGDE